MAETQGALLAERYRLVEQLGRGGMGVVWRAHDEVFDREVAVKEVLLPAELGRDERENVIQRTLHEARVAARLSHPNVVKVYDVVRAGGRPWIVMELVRARSLTEMIEQGGALPAPEVARIGLQVLAALGAAHGAGINHRDVKPGNVLCTETGRVVLTDFGIASLEGDATATTTGPLMGSPSYIAPERVRGRSATPSSDLWSLAATLYAAVEGRPPYDRNGVVQTVTAVVNDDPDPYRLAGPLIPVLTRMFQKDPADRPTAAQIRMMLREVAGPPNRREASPDVPRPRAAIEAGPTGHVAPAAGDADATALTPLPPSGPTPPSGPHPPLGPPPAAGPPRPRPEPAPHKPAARAAGRRVVPMVLVALAVLTVLAGGAAALNSLRSGDKDDRVIPTGQPPAALDQSETGSPEPTPPTTVTTGPAASPTSGVGDAAQPLTDVPQNRPRTTPSSRPPATVPNPGNPKPPAPVPSPAPTTASPTPTPTPTPTPVDPPPPPPTTDPPPPPDPPVAPAGLLAR